MKMTKYNSVRGYPAYQVRTDDGELIGTVERPHRMWIGTNLRGQQVAWSYTRVRAVEQLMEAQ